MLCTEIYLILYINYTSVKKKKKKDATRIIQVQGHLFPIALRLVSSLEIELMKHPVPTTINNPLAPLFIPTVFKSHHSEGIYVSFR